MNTRQLQVQVPDDFPRDGPLSSISGNQFKFVARKIGDRYFVGRTPEELFQRHACCEGLVLQLVEYATSKATDDPDWKHEFFLERTAKAVAHQCQSREWDITPEEQDWIMARVKLLLDS